MLNNDIRVIIINEMRKLTHGKNPDIKKEKEKYFFLKLMDKVSQKNDIVILEDHFYQMFDVPYGFVKLWFFEWLLKNKRQQIEKTLQSILNKPFDIGYCGSYDFSFLINDYNYSLKNSIDIMSITILNPENTEVTIDGEIITVPEALENEDIGWEVKYEVMDCVKETINEMITPYTGMYVSDINTLNY